MPQASFARSNAWINAFNVERTRSRPCGWDEAIGVGTGGVCGKRVGDGRKYSITNRLKTGAEEGEGRQFDGVVRVSRIQGPDFL